MFAKVHSTKDYGNNSGSSSSLMNYLDKENGERELEDHEPFFDHNHDEVNKFKATNILDSYNSAFKEKEAKHFMLTLNPSPKELQHLVDKYTPENQSLSEEQKQKVLNLALKDYTREVMDKYAENFNRHIPINEIAPNFYNPNDKTYEKEYKHNTNCLEKIKNLETNQKGLKGKDLKTNKGEITALKKSLIKGNGREVILPGAQKIATRSLQGNDLVYFAKVERERIYKPTERKYEKEMKFNLDLKKAINNDKTLLSRAFKQGDKGLINKYEISLNKKETQFKKDEHGSVILPGNKKGGNQNHVHVVVHRSAADRSLRMGLSPMANARNSKNKLNGKDVQVGFDRDKFKLAVEKTFDTKFEYQRPEFDKFSYQLNMAINIKAKAEQHLKSAQRLVERPEDILEQKIKSKAVSIVNQAIAKNEVYKAFQKIPMNEKQLQKAVIDLAVKGVINMSKSGVKVFANLDPTSAAISKAIDVVKSAISEVMPDISKSINKGSGHSM